MGYANDLIWEVWSKAEIFAGNDPVFWRKDACGAWIFRGDYENQDSEYGWVVAHIKPLDKGGIDDVPNLYPMHWANTERDSNGDIVCKTTSAGIHNNMNMQNDLQNTNPKIEH